MPWLFEIITCGDPRRFASLILWTRQGEPTRVGVVHQEGAATPPTLSADGASMRVSRLLVFSAIVLLVPAAALATTGSYEAVKCPVCGNEFEGWVWGSTNTHLRDSDFCPHALGDQVLMLDGWTCPRWIRIADSRLPSGACACWREPGS